MPDDGITVRPIGRVENQRHDMDDDRWKGVVSTIALDPDQFTPAALQGLEQFSHVEVLFHLHGIPPEAVHNAARHPRGDPRWPAVGIFAQRAAARPNRLAVTRCRLVGVEGLRLTVDGLDALDGTPVLDVKPYLEEFGPRGPVTEPSWARELMRDYFD
jgi:tRNA-Thr(GGU) m(6)t(6)A37 methyltransferase TsaA